MVLSAILVVKTHKRIKKMEKRLKNIENLVKALSESKKEEE